MASSQSGMGAIPFSGGLAFRVWAPDVDGVGVTGDFNGWSPTTHSLDSEGNGFWSADVPGAKIDQQYKFVIHEGTNPPIFKNDPYASRAT